MTKRARLLVGVVVLGAVLALVLWFRRQRDVPSERGCGPGFVATGPRCLVAEGVGCPAPLVMTALGCDAPEARVQVPAADFEWAPSDWEAPSKIAPLHVRTALFEIDAFEVTVGRATCDTCPLRALADRQGIRSPSDAGTDATVESRVPDAARALSNVTRTEAAFFCASRGGRLPTDAEWLAAARADVSRYPWGDTGAVCRRAAWGLVKGPCANGATGPDTVGAHPSGDTPAGVHDLGGNVSEWVLRPLAPHEGHARGGHFQAEFAAELRTWQDLVLDPETRDSRVGFRCAYDVPSP